MLHEHEAPLPIARLRSIKCDAAQCLSWVDERAASTFDWAEAGARGADASIEQRKTPGAWQTNLIAALAATSGAHVAYECERGGIR